MDGTCMWVAWLQTLELRSVAVSKGRPCCRSLSVFLNVLFPPLLPSPSASSLPLSLSLSLTLFSWSHSLPLSSPCYHSLRFSLVSKSGYSWPFQGGHGHWSQPWLTFSQPSRRGHSPPSRKIPRKNSRGVVPRSESGTVARGVGYHS